jgi:hypothetical protein
VPCMYRRRVNQIPPEMMKTRLKKKRRRRKEKDKEEKTMPTTVQFIIRVIILPFYQLLYIIINFLYILQHRYLPYSRQGFNPGLTARTGGPRQARMIWDDRSPSVTCTYIVYTYTSYGVVGSDSRSLER